MYGVEVSASRLCRFSTEGIAASDHRIRGWVGPRARLDPVQKRKIIPQPVIEPPAVQSAARLYAD
jgi:hypothetical protein